MPWRLESDRMESLAIPMDLFGERVFRLRDPDGFRLIISSGLSA